MSAFKITSNKKYDGAIEVAVEGEEEILKSVDMLELVKQAVGPAKEDADKIMKKLDDMEGRIGTVETKVDDINKRLERIDERLDKFLDRLDKFNHPAPENNRWTQTPSQPHVDDNDVSPKISLVAPKYDTTPIPNYSTAPCWMTAPDQETRERLWHYWHNPDGTLKLNCSVNDAGIKGVDAGGYTGGASYGVDLAKGESWTTKATVTGKGEVVGLNTMPPEPNFDPTTLKDEDNQ